METADRGPVHLIINPHSGYGGKRALVNYLRAAMRAAGITMVEHVTTGPDDATEYARSIPGGARAAIVWGGDGTASEVASGLAGADVPAGELGDYGGAHGWGSPLGQTTTALPLCHGREAALQRCLSRAVPGA